MFDEKLFVDLGENPVTCLADLCWISEYGRAEQLEVKFDEGQMCGNSPSVTIESYIDDMIVMGLKREWNTTRKCLRLRWTWMTLALSTSIWVPISILMWKVVQRHLPNRFSCVVLMTSLELGGNN